MSTDPTAKPLLQLCRRRAHLLRTALNALAQKVSSTRWTLRTMDTLDIQLKSIEGEIEEQENQNDGRNSD